MSSCPFVFDRVHVSYLIAGGTRVLWDVVPEFSDPLPWSFQLQVGSTGNPDADDWQDVGLPVENSFYAIDGEQRAWGKQSPTYYRVELTTPQGIYVSDPTNGLGVLDARDWRIAREIVRKERLQSRRADQDGYLLKRRTGGLKCPACLDLQTDESLRPSCPVCYGTGFQCGYYYPMAGVWAKVDPKVYHKRSGPRGPVADIVVKTRMLMLPLLNELDVWVAGKTDERYFIHTIQHVAEMRGVPLIASVELRPAPYSDIIYTLEIPQQIEQLS